MKKLFMLLLSILVVVMAISVVGCQATSTTSTTTTPTSTIITTSRTTPTTATTTSIATTSVTTTTTTATTAKPPVTLNISAASSLTNALNEINALYVQLNPNVTITPNYGSSGTLQTQITNGAPADIFFSAAESNMDTLQKQNLLINDTRKDLLNNSIVLIVPLKSPLYLEKFTDLVNANVKLVAIGDPKSVPAGTYALKAFDELGITAQVQPKEVLGSNVTQVLTYVESGNVDAGVVYLTDALASTKVQVVATGPADVNAGITYPIAVINSTKVPDTAKDYVNFLSTAQAKTIFLKYGFNLTSK